MKVEQYGSKLKQTDDLSQYGFLKFRNTVAVATAPDYFATEALLKAVDTLHYEVFLKKKYI